MGIKAMPSEHRMTHDRVKAIAGEIREAFGLSTRFPRRTAAKLKKLVTEIFAELVAERSRLKEARRKKK